VQQEPFKGPATSAEPAARPRFAVWAAAATIVLAAVTSGIALAGGLRASGEDAPVAQPAWLSPPAAIMAKPEAPLAPPEPASKNVVVPAAPDPGAQLALPAPRGSSTAADDELPPNEPRLDRPQPRALPGNAAQRPQGLPLSASNPAPVPPTEPGKDKSSESEPTKARVTQPDGSAAVDPECRPADSELGLHVLLDDAGRVRRIEIGGVDVPCVYLPIRLVLYLRGDAPDISVTIKVSKDRVIVFTPEKPFFPRDVQGITVKPA